MNTHSVKLFILQYVYGYVEESATFIKSLVSKRLPKDQRFVIFARGRSGSTLLVSLLNSNQNVHCDGEILNHRMISPGAHVHRKCQMSHAEVYGFKLLSYQLRSIQKFKNPQQFLRDLHVQGFKIIYLRRENLLRHALSKAYAQYTNRWHSHGPSGATEKMLVIPSEILSSIRESDRLHQFELSVLNEIPHLTLTYEEDLESKEKQISAIKKISDFLEISLSEPVTTLVKTSSTRIPDFVKNADELAEYLKGTEYSVFLDEHH